MLLPTFVLKYMISVSVSKLEDDYLYLSQQLRPHGKLEILVYGTDGEPALERAFERIFPIEGKMISF